MQSVLYPLSQPLGVPLEWKADVDESAIPTAMKNITAIINATS